MLNQLDDSDSSDVSSEENKEQLQQDMLPPMDDHELSQKKNI